MTDIALITIVIWALLMFYIAEYKPEHLGHFFIGSLIVVIVAAIYGTARS